MAERHFVRLSGGPSSLVASLVDTEGEQKNWFSGYPPLVHRPVKDRIRTGGGWSVEHDGFDPKDRFQTGWGWGGRWTSPVGLWPGTKAKINLGGQALPKNA